MPLVPRRTRGFTLIELMVTVAVVLILGILAVPSFVSFRSRTALRASTEEVASFWNQARFEAAKRNQMVKVGVKTSGANFCLGAATTTNASDTTPCDCFTANACNVAGYPAPPTGATFDTQSEWAGVSFVTVSGTTPTLGGTNNSVAVIEPKRGGLADSAAAGSLTFADPKNGKDYKVNVRIDALGRPLLCESALAADHMPEFISRGCTP
jgi:prepilin-type N-terminal cleavage/methylation domain-containing protein